MVHILCCDRWDAGGRVQPGGGRGSGLTSMTTSSQDMSKHQMMADGANIARQSKLGIWFVPTGKESSLLSSTRIIQTTFAQNKIETAPTYQPRVERESEIWCNYLQVEQEP